MFLNIVIAWWVVLADFRHKKEDIAPIVVGVVLGSCLIIVTLGILRWRYYFRTKSGKEGGLCFFQIEKSQQKHYYGVQ